MRNLLGLFILTTALLSTGCAPAFEAATKSFGSEGLQGANPGTDNPTDPSGSPSTSVPAASDTVLGICSRLDFTGVQWPTQLMTLQRRAMALALNITGSFEGSAGWSNLTNNFDGQGMSLGLNQQNLGQGSLQPLLTSVIKTNPTLMKTLFSTANLNSMTAMLNVAKISFVEVRSLASMSNEAAADELFPDTDGLTALDENFATMTTMAITTETSSAVNWAKKNLYLANGSTFKTDWKNSFLSLAASAPYRSLQVEAALTMYTKAIGYFRVFKFKELRSLLTMYDFVVQNGGFTAANQASYNGYIAKNPQASETARLMKLLEIRLVSVRSQYRADVSARKSAIINGSGRVHGAARNLQQEYCFKGSDTL